MEPKNKRDPYRLTGTTLGKYQILRCVGVGGMGAVYFAQHVMTEGKVALKILKPDLAFTAPETLKYFFEEAKKTVGLNHPYIIKVTDADVVGVTDKDGNVENEIAFLVMEWLDGHTLENELKEHGALPLERVTMLLDQICEGLAHAHARGIIHRDLKPGNIMVVVDHKNEEVVRIVDFGIAKALNSTMGINSGLMGAPYYASPEQMSLESKIDHRSDIYSLGVMVYQLLTGQLPFDATTFEQLIQQHLTSPPPSICQVRPEIPTAVEEVVARALAKKSKDRYESAGELARAFRRATNLDMGVLNLACVDALTGQGVADAAVYLDGKHVGETDHRGHYRKSLVPREYEVEIDRHPYLAAKGRVTVSPRVDVDITVEITPKELGELVVHTNLAGAGVYIDRKLAGRTDAAGTLHLKELPPGRTIVEVKNPDETYTYAAQVEIVRWQQTALEAELPAGPVRSPVGAAARRVFAGFVKFVTLPMHAMRGRQPRAPHALRRLLLIAAGVVLFAGVAAAAVFAARAAVRMWRAQGERVLVTPTPAPTPQPSTAPTPDDSLPPTPTPPPAAQPYAELATLPTDNNEYYQLALSPDGRVLASVGDKNRASLWSVDERRPLVELQGAVTGGSVAISPGGDIVAAGGDDKAIRLWRTSDGVLVNTLRGHADAIFFVGFSADSQTLVSASQDGTIKVWPLSDVPHVKTYLRLKADDEIIAITRDQTTAALWSASAQSVSLRLFGEYKPLRRLEGAQPDWTSGEFSEDGKLLAAGSKDGTVHIWRVSDGSLAGTLQRKGGAVRCMAFSPDGATLAAGMEDGTIHLLGVEGDTPSMILEGHQKQVYSLSFSADGRVLASEADDNSVRLWNVKPTER